MDNLKIKFKYYKKNILRVGSLALAMILLTPTTSFASQNIVLGNGNDIYYINPIEQNTKELNERLFEIPSYERDAKDQIETQNQIREEEAEELAKKQEEQREAVKLMFEEKMRILQEQKEAEERRIAALSTSESEEKAEKLGLVRGSIGDTTTKDDVRIIVDILEPIKLDLTETQKEIVKLLPEYLGKPYGWGTSGPKSYDCSGFTSNLHKKMGKKIPRTAADQYISASNKIPVEDLRLGDLVFFKNTGDRTGITHVGMYIGNGIMVHASYTYNKVKTENVFGGYFKGKYVGAARYLD